MANREWTKEVDYVMQQIELDSKTQKRLIDVLQDYKEEYDKSVKIGLTSKNYQDRLKAYRNASSVMRENGIDEMSFYRNPFDIAYSLDFAIRRLNVEDITFRKSMQYLLTGKELKRMFTITEEKDEEIKLQEQFKSTLAEVL